MEQYYGYKIEVDEKELDDIFCEIEKRGGRYIVPIINWGNWE